MEKSYNTIERELAKIGYLQIFLKHKGGYREYSS